MKEFEELKQLWQDHRPDIHPDFEQVMERIESYRKRIASRLWKHIMAFCVGLLAVFYIWFTVSFVTWTTHTAILLVTACMVYSVYYQWKSYRYIQRSPHAIDKPEAYIAYLKQYRTSYFKFNTRSYRVYEVGIGLAFLFYSFELYFALPLGMFIGLCLFLIFWYLVTHFVFIRSYIKNEEEKIADMLADLDRISNQFDEH